MPNTVEMRRTTTKAQFRDGAGIIVRWVSYGAIGTTENKLKPNDFNDYFTLDKPIVVNFHGYPETAFSIFSHYNYINIFSRFNFVSNF